VIVPANSGSPSAAPLALPDALGLPLKWEADRQRQERCLALEQSLLFCCKSGKLIAIAVMPRRSGHQIIVITTASGALAPALILYSAFSDLVGITIIETLPHQVAILRSMTLLYFY
jgi:hypothetical protein